MSSIDTQRQTSLYEELLEKDGLVSIHHKNIQTLEVITFQIKNGMYPEIVSDVFFAKA